eukprot:365989-Chlamydomonas_euryale.AAC.8
MEALSWHAASGQALMRSGKRGRHAAHAGQHGGSRSWSTLGSVDAVLRMGSSWRGRPGRVGRIDHPAAGEACMHAGLQAHREEL